MKKLLTNIGLTLGLSLILAAGAANSAFAYSTEGAMYYNEGLDLYSRGEYAKALQSFKTAVAKDPDFIDAYYNMGALYEYLKSYNSAIASYSKIYQLDPNDKETVLKLSELYFKLGNYERALFYITKINENDDLYGKAQSLKNQIVVASQKAAAKNALANNNSANETNKTIVDKFSGPTGLAIDSKGILYVASYTDNSIYKVMPNGQSQLFSKSPLLGGPIGLAFDSMDNLYVANYAKSNILKINKAGQVYTFMNKITNPYYLIIKGNYMYITEQGNNNVIKYKLY